MEQGGNSRFQNNIFYCTIHGEPIQTAEEGGSILIYNICGANKNWDIGKISIQSQMQTHKYENAKWTKTTCKGFT